ncbi:arylsulfatase [Thelonectria olida]|uniref:Arylsulfatase n=1 Tax=Thelonectria olida TaxID=1576542 RepID=A0A9P8W613_9HYPO|nr:arylsulfatase [Thelonectria olida]
MYSAALLSTLTLALAATGLAKRNPKKSANIILVMTDDQDRRLGSTDYQYVLQREVKAKGTEFINHYATTANCCPSRTSLLRGQMVHNTNVTHVNAPGGNYDKFVISGQDTDYLPFWMKKAGYRVEYIGKFLNGYSQKNYNITPKGWDHVDALVDPYTYVFNTPVMSLNGQRPIYYEGYHQSDVIRAKALDRVEHLTSQDDPFLLVLAPSTPHVQNDKYQSIPLSRHAEDFANVTAPRGRNWNPADKYQKNKGSWLSTLPLMNDSVEAYADHSYRQRIRALQGVDEMMEDVIALLEEKGAMENTHFIFTTDNGYHIGNHRIPAGKALFYAEDTNLPFVVRGPDVPAGITSKIPGAHLDLAPTFLDIAGVSKKEWPEQLDGQSLLDQWHHPLSSTGKGSGGGNAKETLNVEFWGLCIIEAPNGAELGIPFRNNSYKSLRIVGEDESWLYSYWCTGETELYNTAKDPYELDNLAVGASKETSRLIDRLNAILLVTKSCAQGTCRQPWTLLQPGNCKDEILSLKQAMKRKYDDFFAGFPRVAFKECLQIQDIGNERPFYPALPETGALGQKYRNSTDNYQSEGEGGTRYIGSPGKYGSWDQRHADLDEINRSAREITDAEIYGDSATEKRRRDLGIADNPEWMQWIG